MDLGAIPVVDTHAHPFPPAQGAVEWGTLRDAMSVSLRGQTTSENDSILLVRMLVKRLSRLLGCAPAIDSVTTARNERAADPAAYHRLLWDDAKIASVLIDPGFPSSPVIEAPEFAAVMPCPVYEGYRIERFAAHPVRDTPYDYDAFASFADLVEAFNDRLDREAAKPGFRFYKSIIAYITGLHLTTPTEAEVLDAWQARPSFREKGEKQLRDFLFHQAALKALEHDVPFQVHTGHTSHNQPWRNANPIEITPFLNTPRMDEVTFVLVHGGYPFNTEAGYICSVYPKIFLDLSLMIPWSSIGIARRIEETFEFAPTSKVMYGSDGIMVPELYWISALNARQALGKVLDGLIADDVLDAGEAEEVAHDVLHRTAERVYRV